MLTKFWSENLKGRDELGTDRRIILKLILQKYSGRVWSKLI
jgi:hypothetical protein